MSSRNKLSVIRLPGTTQLLFLVAQVCLVAYVASLLSFRAFTFCASLHVETVVPGHRGLIRDSLAVTSLFIALSTYLYPVFWGCLKLQSAVRPFCAHAANDVFHFLNRKQFCKTFALLLCLKNCYCSRTDNYFYYCLLVSEFLAAFGCGI